MANERFCPNCGTGNEAGASFCEECGERLTAVRSTRSKAPSGAASPRSRTKQTCANCGTENRANVSFCEECGEPLAGTAEQTKQVFVESPQPKQRTIARELFLFVLKMLVLVVIGYFTARAVISFF